jgi:pre-mRNA-splicing factor ATP-dependent RNA helicase DHX16
MGDLVTWVGDSLHTLLGFSDKTLAAYFVAVASKAKNAGAVLSELAENDVPVTDATKQFAVELYKRVPRKAVATAPASSSNAAELRKSQQYKLVAEEPLPVPVQASAPAGRASTATTATMPSVSVSRTSTISAGVASLITAHSTVNSEPQSTKSSRLEDRKRHLRKHDSTADAEEDEHVVPPVSTKRPRSDEAADRTSALDPEELARLRDQREKEEFEQRLLQRDEQREQERAEERESRARKAGGDRAALEDLLAAGAADEEFRGLRKVSRRQYLQMREKRELELLADAIKLDEELIRSGERFTAAEREKYERNKRLYALATTKVEDSKDNEDRYHLPDAMQVCVRCRNTNTRS